MQSKFLVADMSCGHCKSAVEGALALEGVDSAEVNLDEKTVTVEWDPEVIEETALVSAIGGAGYSAETISEESTTGAGR